MTTAYDLSDLAGRLKSKGLNLAEDAVKAAIHEVMAWVTESAKLSPTPFDDVALILAPQIEKWATDAADKIDGEVG